jgi:hypothetical protein
VTVCCTTDDDVHRVACGSDEPCIGIHVYGANIGALSRRRYDHLVTDGVAIQRTVGVCDREADPDIGVGGQQLPVFDEIGAGSIAAELLGAEMARQQRRVRLGRRVGAVSDEFRLEQSRRGVAVVQERAIGGEALDAHQLLGVEAPVLAAELEVTLSRHCADGTVVRHGV